MPENAEFADPEVNVADDIDLLIGAELFYSLLETDQTDFTEIAFRIVNFGAIQLVYF